MMIPVFENQDNFTMQEFRDNEIDELYDDLMAVLEKAYASREYMDESDVRNVVNDVLEDFSVVLP